MGARARDTTGARDPNVFAGGNCITLSPECSTRRGLSEPGFNLLKLGYFRRLGLRAGRCSDWAIGFPGEKCGGKRSGAFSAPVAHCDDAGRRETSRRRRELDAEVGCPSARSFTLGRVVILADLWEASQGVETMAVQIPR